MDAGALAPGRVCTEFPKDKEFRAFEMLEKIEFSLKPRRCARHHEENQGLQERMLQTKLSKEEMSNATRTDGRKEN
jgi:hypothetical protein